MPRVVTNPLAADATGNYAVEMFVDEIEWHIENDPAQRSFAEVLDWAYPRSRKLSYEEANRRALEAKTLHECHSILRQAGKGSRGRVAKQRIPAIKALIYHEQLKWTWAKVAKVFCACEKKKHDANCPLRSEVVQLKRLLRKYGVSFR
ncbi:MAG TPA: hypothetical protein VN622_05915 [Clostridia bacterium]|nr:hypothetical protein [Clostridia bacterium]